MNKKFSTLMAGLMLASAFSVADAQTPSTKYENGKYYLLNTPSSGCISVISEPGANYGKLYLDNTISGLTDTRNALWKVTVTQEKVGDTPKYSFVNVATGQILSVGTPVNSSTPLPAEGISGSFMEWYAGLSSTAVNTTAGETFMSYVGKNDVVYLKQSSTSYTGYGFGIDVYRGSVTTAKTNCLSVFPAEAAIVDLGAEELNKELIMNNEEDVFTLSFNRDVTEGTENLFTGVQFVAKDNVDDSNITPGYVRLQVKDTKNYLVVDTALHAGSEADRQLPKFAYDDPNKDVVDGNNVKRLDKSFNFKFAYDPTNNRVLIKSEAYYTRAFNNTTGSLNVYGTVSGTNTGDGNIAYTGWGPNAANSASWFESGIVVKDAYVRLVELSSVRELTVASNQIDGASYVNNTYLTQPTDFNSTEWSEADHLTYGMLTNVTIGKGVMAYEPTTIPTGLYMIQYIKGDEQKATANDYFVANLGGFFGYAEQAKNQDYDHIPAAQWYVEQQGSIPTAPVTITNREFFDQKQYNSGTDNIGNAFSMQAFKAEDGNYFFASGAFNGETLKFIPVSAASKADSLLGYKHVDERQASVETYVFNYLHGLSKDNGLNTPSDKDSLVRVDETGEKASFRLVPVVEHDSYGMQLSATDVKATGVANLLRNAYYIKAYDNSKFEGDRYLTYDEASKKYVMTFVPTAYFLKENNCIDGTHYYALVEASLFDKAYDVSSSSNWDTYLQTILDKIYPAQFVNKNTVTDEANVWSFYQLTQKEKTLANGSKIANPLSEKQREDIKILFYDKNGEPIISDASEDVALYAYMPDNDGVIKLQRVKDSRTTGTIYYAMNPKGTHKSIVTGNSIDRYSNNYAESRISVDDNTLDLTIAAIEDKWNDEIRVSAFEVAVNDAPLYRRFNGVAPEAYGDASNAPLNLKFFRHNNNAEYLFENYASDNSYRDGITDKSISFLGVNNAYQFEETATRSYTMFVDTAYVRNNTRMPQYLIAVKPEVVEGDTILCDASTHQHATPEEALACEHTQIKVGFTRAMYLFNAQDSVDVKNYDYQGKAAYGAQGYTRLAFKDAVHAQDTLYILNPGVTTEQLKASNLKDDKMFAKKIALDNNKHKNVVFQFRLIDEDNNRFLIESEAEQNGAAVLNKDLQNVCVAPMRGGWVKVQNGVPVIARFQDFNEAIAQAEVFDVNDEIKYDATANDEIAVEGVSVVAGNGQVTIMGAAGKNVTITNILGKVIASQVIASDNATIAVPAGIVAVAVEGEAAVKAIVK